MVNISRVYRKSDTGLKIAVMKVLNTLNLHEIWEFSDRRLQGVGIELLVQRGALIEFVSSLF